MTIDAVEVSIQEALAVIPERAKVDQWQGDREWTKAVKEAIVAVGHHYDWLTVANGVKADDGVEWLYDVVWYQSDSAGIMTDVPLVAESEWGNEKHIKYDFEKLLVSRSKYRVMVFQAGNVLKCLNFLAKCGCGLKHFISPPWGTDISLRDGMESV